MRKLCRETGCDVWFPFYPLCMEHCITETYAMVYECYRRMVGLYGGGNVSTCGFSSGGALALGIAAHNNAQPEPLTQPRHIVVSPARCRGTTEKVRMQALNERTFPSTIPFGDGGEVHAARLSARMCRTICSRLGEILPAGDIHFFYSADEVLYGALPDFETPCKRANVPYTVSAARRWCIATVCCRSSRKQRRTLRKSWTF